MHQSVLLKECLEFLNLEENSIIVDCTLGRAGHSSEILKRISNGYLYAFDQDPEAIGTSKEKLEQIASNFTIIPSNFVHLKEELKNRNVLKVNGILFDLGVSSPQLDEDERGFSFHKDAPLDMRMDQNQELSAYHVVNEYSYEQLVSIFYKYGEEKFAPSIARKIEQARMIKPIETTLELVEIIKTGVPEKYKREKHPARKVFQAIRIEVNHELQVFEQALRDALDILEVGGRICVITFHSLEDRICKQIYKEVTMISKEVQKLPVIPEEYQPHFQIVKTIEPTSEEIEDNRRARSATLRVIERVKEG